MMVNRLGFVNLVKLDLALMIWAQTSCGSLQNPWRLGDRLFTHIVPYEPYSTGFFMHHWKEP